MVESGIFYATFVDPVLSSMRKRVARQILSGQTVIDIACGTGAQIFEIAEKTSRAVGIDISESMIKKAKQNQLRSAVANVEFFVRNATNLSSFKPDEFDISLMTLALHQFPTDLHTTILSQMKRISKKILLVDYNFPLPKNYVGYGSRIAEFLAGKEHNANFKKYCKEGGLIPILEKNQLKIETVEKFAKDSFLHVVCSPVK